MSYEESMLVGDSFRSDWKYTNILVHLSFTFCNTLRSGDINVNLVAVLIGKLFWWHTRVSQPECARVRLQIVGQGTEVASGSFRCKS